MARVVIVGAGVGGTLVANRLAGRGLDVTVLNSFPDHLNQPAFLYRSLGRRFRTEAPLRRLLRPGVRVLVGKVTAVNLERREVRGDSLRIPYDFLVLATGSRLADREIPGFEPFAHHFHCRAAARRLSAALEQFKGGRIVVGACRLPYKCPPAPHEFIFLLQEYLRRRRTPAKLTFAYPRSAIFSKPATAQVLDPLFEERGIEKVTDFELASVEPNLARSKDGRELSFDLLVMVPPHVGAPLAKASGLAGPNGWIPVDRFTLKACERVYVLGDAADLTVPKSGAAAHYQAEVVARNVLSEALGQGPVARYDGGVT
jgi:sulfide:quinone oxidoreductase